MMRETVLILAVLLLLAAAGCTATEETNDDPDAADTNDDAQIYAAAIRQIYDVDHSFGDPPGWPLVYAVTTTTDSAMVDTPSAPSQKLAADLQEAIAAELANEPFELIWIEAFDDAPIDPANGQISDGDGIIITLGNIHSQDDGTVQLPFFMTCGGLCGIGKTYVLNQVDGVWQIFGSVGPEVVS
jgi:hypothetical protein